MLHAVRPSTVCQSVPCHCVVQKRRYGYYRALIEHWSVHCLATSSRQLFVEAVREFTRVMMMMMMMMMMAIVNVMVIGRDSCARNFPKHSLDGCTIDRATVQ